MLKIAPQPIDVQDLQFKLRCRLKVFDNTDNSNFSKLCSLVTCASRFGLIFVGLNTSSAQVIQLKNIEEYSKADGDKSDYPRRIFPLPSPPLHLSVNCEHTILAVIIEKNGCPCVVFYDVKSFLSQNISQIGEIRLSPTPGTQVTEVNWNPALSNIFTACKSDGSLGIYEIKNPGIDINELPAAAGATCFCWSPKGKQIAVGSRDGKITQYKPDLKAVKVINAPPLKEPYSIQSLQWVSNYQFIGVFQPVNPDNQVSFIVIDAPKTGDPIYTNYDDICYGNGNTRPPQFYTVLLQNWNILMAASSNSMEVGILGNSGDCWTQWIMGDAARAELPLSANHQDTLPIGCALGIGCTQPIPWGESTLPPAPILLLLSHHGTLCCFNVVYLKEGIPGICTPPDPVKDTSGLPQFVSVPAESKSKDSQLKETPKVGQQVILQVPNVENVKPATTSSAPANTPTTLFKVQPNLATSTPLPLNLSQSSPVSLFGGQVTLTQQESKNSSQSSLISKYKPLYPAAPSAILTKIVTSAPVVQSSASTTTVATSAIAKPVVSTASPKLPEPSVDLNKTDDINVDIKAEEEAEAIFAQMIREECIYLDSELKAALNQGKHLKLNLGTDETKTKIVENTKLLQDFFREVVETCTSQNAEIHILKQNVLQSWAWYEEINSRHLASEDKSMMILMRAQPLDSVSEKQLADIQHANYYLESQIAQANLALDEQWENFQDHCKNIRKIQIPTMEMIFQTMVKQNAILRKQSFILKDIQNRIKSKSRSAVGSSFLLTVDADKDLPNELNRLRMDPEDICLIQRERVMNRTKNFTRKKSDALRSYLKKKEIRHVSAMKPQLSSSSISRPSPKSKLKQFTLTPKTPSAVPKKLDFVQSTPNLTSSKLQPSTPIEGLQNFALKFEAKNFTNLPEKTFIPLTKSGISSSPNSAFVSTSFGSSASTSVSTSTSLFFKPTTPVVKTTPNYIVTSTAAETNQPIIMISANLSKAFSFISSPAISVSSQNNATGSKSAPNLFSNSTTKSPLSFNFQAVSTVTSAFGETEAKIATPAFNVTSPTSSAAFNFNATTKLASTTADSSAKTPSTPGVVFAAATSAKPASTTTLFGTAGTTKAPSAPNLIFGSGTSVVTKPSLTSSTVFNTTTATTTVAPFSFDSSATNIFGTANQKSTETASVSTTPKSFMFSPRTTSTSITTTSAAPAVSSVSVSSSLSDATKLTSISQPLVTNSVVVTPKSTIAATASSTSIFASPASSNSFLVGSLTGASNPSSVFNNSVGSTQSSVFSVGSTKATSVTVTPSVTSTAAAASTPAVTTATTANVVGTRSPNTPSIASNVSGNEAVTSQQSIFVSAVSLSSQSSTPTSGLLFSNIPSTKPSIFGSGDAGSPKMSVFGDSTPAATTGGFGTATTTMQSLFSSIPSAGTQPAIFGGTTAATGQSSVFAAVPSTTAQSSVFAAVPSTTTPSSVFAAGPSTAAQSSVFAAVPSATTQSSVFAAVPSATTQSPVFAAVPPTTTPSSVFAAVSSTTTQSSIFSAVPSTSAPSLFGAATPQSSVFAAVPSTTSSSVFSSVPSSPASVFGAATPATTSSLFGLATNQASPFGGSLSSASQQSIFGSTAPTTTSQSPHSIFGTPPSTTSQPQSFGMFGDAPQKSSIFGGAAVTSTQSSVFGGSNQSVFGGGTGSAFGQHQAASAFGQTSAFGSSGSSFGGTNAFGSSATNYRQNSGSIFGSTPTTSSGSIFGTTSTTGSAFGTSSSIFGTPASSASSPFSSGTVFASTASQPSTGSFGFGGLNVGSTPTTTNSGFGTTPSANPFGGNNKSVFGSPPASSSTSVFGSNTGSLFGSPPSQTFGGGFGNQSPFGQQSTFGQSSFGSASFGQQSSGPFSGGNSPGVGQTGFGAAPSFQKSSGFGTAPVFGGSPSFGNTPSFGGAPSFGSSPTFGSGAKVFGASNPGFGATTSNQTAGFGNLATQPTVGFGNLAQQAVNTPSSGTAFSGNSSFSSWR